MPRAHPDRTLSITVAICATAVFALLTLLVVTDPAQPLINDLAIQTWVQHHRASWLDRPFAIFTSFGSGPVLLVVGVLGAGWLSLRQHRLGSALPLLLTFGSTADLVALIKIIVHRERPDVAGLLGRPALDYAFPSGHSTDSAVVYVSLALTLGLTRRGGRRLLVGLAVAVSGLIGASRIYLGYHYLSDVVGGWLLAVAVMAAVSTLSSMVMKPDLDQGNGSSGSRTSNRHHV